MRLAAAEVKKGKDVNLYERVMQLFGQIAPYDSASKQDSAWIDRTNSEAAAESHRLEGELRGYKNNLIKESIRVGYVNLIYAWLIFFQMAYDDIGRYYQHIGALGEAIKNFNREREYCQLPTHICIMVNRLINANIEQNNWLSVKENVNKIQSLPQKPVDADKLDAKLISAQGLAEMCTQQYRKAALTLVECNPYMVHNRQDDPAIDDLYNSVMSPSDVATYGALCALATMGRGELKKHVLENNKFRNYLELEPHLRRAISSFVAGKYSQCLDILQAYRTDYLLDLYLSSHYDRLFNLVRNKAIVQYLIPYSRVTFSALATAFKTNEQDIVDSLIELIQSHQISAMLDLECGLLVTSKTESRPELFKSALESSQEYEKMMQSQLLRFAIVNANLEVQSPKQQQVGNVINNPDTLIARDTNVKGKKNTRETQGFFS